MNPQTLNRLIIVLGMFALIAVVFLILAMRLKTISDKIGLWDTIANLKKTKEFEGQMASLAEQDSIYSNIIDQSDRVESLQAIKAKGKMTLLSIFYAINSQDLSRLTPSSVVAYSKLKNLIDMQLEGNQKEYFQDINFLDTFVTGLDNKEGYSNISLYQEVEYLHYITHNDNLVNGSISQMQKDAYILSLVYISDLEKLSDEDKEMQVFASGEGRLADLANGKYVLIDFVRA